jgi:hypothetical protein
MGRLDADTDVLMRLPPTVVVGLGAEWAGEVLRAALVGATGRNK